MNYIFMDMFFSYGHGLDMKEEGKGLLRRSKGEGKEDSDFRQDSCKSKRRSIRLPGYDYSRTGAYFVTICTKDRKCLFGDIVNPNMALNNAGRMVEMAKKYPEASGLEKRALNQAARELLLAQASDWAFIMYAGTMVDYAVKRTRDHLIRFTRLYRDIRKGKIDETWLADIESKDNIFPHIDYRVYV